MKKLLALGFLLATSPAFAVDPSTNVCDANYAVTNTDTRIILTCPLTSPRTITLPFVGSTQIGQSTGPQGPTSYTLEIVDAVNAITSTNTLTVTPQAGDRINNALNAPVTVNNPGAHLFLWPVTGNNWLAQTLGLAPVQAGQIPGTATSDNAAPGNVGEYIVSTIAAGGAIPLLTGVSANMTTVTLTPGDWDCSVNSTRTLGAGTSVTSMTTAISTSPASVLQFATNASAYTVPPSVSTPNPNGVSYTGLTPIVRFSLASSTPIFAVVQDIFTVSTDTAFGTLRCRRVR